MLEIGPALVAQCLPGGCLAASSDSAWETRFADCGLLRPIPVDKSNRVWVTSGPLRLQILDNGPACKRRPTLLPGSRAPTMMPHPTGEFIASDVNRRFTRLIEPESLWSLPAAPAQLLPRQRPPW